MSNNKLTHSGSSQNLQRNTQDTALNAPDSNTVSSQELGGNSQAQEYFGNANQQFRENTGSNQQLRSGSEEQAYKSEEHRHVYQNTSQSFNEQRDKYAEQALNQPPPEQSYDYQAASSSEPVNDDSYQRYTQRHETAASDSIFAASDIELANATENYLQKDSNYFKGQLDQLDQRTERVTNRIYKIETNDLQYRNSHKPWKHRLIMDQEYSLKHKKKESWHTGSGKSERIHVNVDTAVAGRLRFRSEKIALTEKQHNHKVRAAERRFTRWQVYGRKLRGGLKSAASGSNFSEDEIAAELSRKRRHAMIAAGYTVKRNYRKLKHELDGYSRLRYQSMRLDALNARKELLKYRSGIDLQKRKAAEASRQGLLREKQKRKIKKEMVQSYKREQGNFFTRTNNQHKLKKTVKKEKRMKKQRIKTMISSFASLLSMMVLVVFVLFALLFMLVIIGGENMAFTTSQNNYYDMTEVTAYFRNKEAELEEYIKPENLEPIILEEYPEIFEFIYDMDEISFDANTLVAYLSAKYNEFDLEMVQADLDEIFELYYTLEWEVKEEYRMLPDTTQPPDPVTGEYPMINKLVQICYVTLRKENFYELLQGRIDDAAKQGQMNGFYLTGNGQQVYGPVMEVDWRNKISSNYGWRVHPITGKRVFHDGVDIAIPTGTALYSAVKGTVIDSHYSDSAGNMIIIQNESGWKITFMHMDSRAVSVGDTIEQGQFVGYSGNTGNSTGPHLHIRVHDANDDPINPVFIVPFSTIKESDTY